MRCPSCEPDYCACADFYGGRLKYWKGEMMTDTLPQRIEAAEGADRELDCRIWWRITQGEGFDTAAAVVPDFDQWQAPAYTASIEAALTLVDAESDPLDILEEAIASCRDARDGILFLPLHIIPAALRAKEQTHD